MSWTVHPGQRLGVTQSSPDRPSAQLDQIDQISSSPSQDLSSVQVDLHRCLRRLGGRIGHGVPLPGLKVGLEHPADRGQVGLSLGSLQFEEVRELQPAHHEVP